MGQKNPGHPSTMMPKMAEIRKYVPVFVLGFVGMSIARTLGDVSLDHYGSVLGLLDGQQWKSLTNLLGNQIGSHYLLGTAMAAVGLSTNAAALKGVGYKPFVVGLAGAGVV